MPPPAYGDAPARRRVSHRIARKVGKRRMQLFFAADQGVLGGVGADLEPDLVTTAGQEFGLLMNSSDS